MERSTRHYDVPDTVPFRKGDRWGFVNQAGDTVIPFEYGFASPFVEDRASVLDRNTGLGTYLDREGKPIAPFIYTKVVPFQHGLGIIMLDGKWGALNKDGEEVITAEYERLFLHDIPMHGYIYAKHGGKWGVIDQQGREVKPFIYDEIGQLKTGDDDLISVKLNSSYGFMGKNLEWVIPPKEGRYFPGQFNDGLIPIREGNLSGFLNDKGREVIPPQYYEVGNFGEGLAPVKVNLNDKVWYFIDTQGERVKEVEVYSMGYFSHGVAPVEFQDETEGYLNKNFEVIFKGNYWLNDFEDGYGVISQKDGDGLFGAVDEKGDTFLEVKYEYLQYRKEYDLFVFWENGLKGLMTPDKEIVFPAEAKNIDWTTKWYENLVLITTPDNREGYIDLNGRKYYSN
ncbi:WG repeat-containing protein [Roseivirga sp. BDSF3-8]|uniref:WG repeat-containing protein n=1 Tax=Roseivirga sp. BDSF3-8 TaxID=3241598 RepID=UPI003531D150